MQSIRQSVWKQLCRDKHLIIMAVPAIVYYILFSYVPMTGLQKLPARQRPVFGRLGVAEMV